MSLSDALAMAAAAESGISVPSVGAADPHTITEAELQRMDKVQVDNDSELEMKGIGLAVEYLEQHWKLLCSCGCSTDIVLSSDAEQDAALYRSFRENFPSLNIEDLSVDSMKHERSRTQWRSVLDLWEGRLRDHNMICLLRYDCRSGYDNANTMLVPRAQFLMIEIARNREGLNDVRACPRRPGAVKRP
jgi:hypothetical protein